MDRLLIMYANLGNPLPIEFFRLSKYVRSQNEIKIFLFLSAFITIDAFKQNQSL